MPHNNGHPCRLKVGDTVFIPATVTDVSSAAAGGFVAVRLDRPAPAWKGGSPCFARDGTLYLDASQVDRVKVAGPRATERASVEQERYRVATAAGVNGTDGVEG